MIQAEILADSLNPQGNRLTTFKVVFPRIVLAEFNTHRMFSRNSASSRAIPFKKMVKMVKENPFIPLAWQTDHKGMQGTEYITDGEVIEAKNKNWIGASKEAIRYAKYLNSNVVEHTIDFGDNKRKIITYNHTNDSKLSGKNNVFIEGTSVTKQLCNRLLEPFMWHTVIVTSSEEGLENFFKLRCPQYISYDIDKEILFRSKKDFLNFKGTPNDKSDLLHFLNQNKSQAEIHIQSLAECMWDAYNESKPKQLRAGEWHIPFYKKEDYTKVQEELGNITSSSQLEDILIKISVARCARLSYQTLGDDPKIDYEADIKLHDRLAEMEHWSPFEHVAVAMKKSYNEFGDTFGIGDIDNMDHDYNYHVGMCRNFKGFVQYRALIDNNGS